MIIAVDREEFDYLILWSVIPSFFSGENLGSHSQLALWAQDRIKPL